MRSIGVEERTAELLPTLLDQTPLTEGPGTERQALALMDHPNIAKVFDAGATDSGRPFFVMELVRGIRITHYCDQEKLSTSQRIGLFIKVCQAQFYERPHGVQMGT